MSAERVWGNLTRAGHFAANGVWPAAKWAFGAIGASESLSFWGKMSRAFLGQSVANFRRAPENRVESGSYERGRAMVDGWQQACDGGWIEDEETPNARFGPQAFCRPLRSGKDFALRRDDRQLRVAVGARPDSSPGGLGSPALPFLLTLGSLVRTRGPMTGMPS
jgi:hypothetical protein